MPDFFNLFTFPVIEGNKQPLAGLNDVVITKSTATAIFGNEDPIGKSVSLKYEDQSKGFIVSGLINDPPANSSISANMIVRFEQASSFADNMKHWDNLNHMVFLQLSGNTTPQSFERSLTPFVKKHFADRLSDLKRDGARILPDGERQSLILTPFANSHFNTEITGMPGGQPISEMYVIGLLIIAIFILVIACINFINLSVARGFTRAREVGVRKTLGAGVTQLLMQFWLEAILVCLIAFVAGIAIAALGIPSFNATFREPYSASDAVTTVKNIGIARLVLNHYGCSRVLPCLAGNKV